MDASERERLVTEHLDISRRAAAVIYPRVKEHIEFDELVALGNQGLVEAAQRYEHGRGASFNTFAWYRVHGAIIDGLRKSTHLPRRVWAKLVALRAASEYLEHRGERDAGAAERGAQPASGPDALGAIKSAMASIKMMYMTSLDTLSEEDNFQPAATDESAETTLDTQRVAKALRKAIDELPEKERELLKRHYYEGKNLLEAGAELGISKSWASRLHAQAVDRLRDLVDARLRLSAG